MTFIPPTTAQVSDMDAAVKLMENSLDSLNAKLATQDTGWRAAFNWLEAEVADVTGMEATSAAYWRWLAQSQALKTTKYAAVIAGTYSLENWFGEAKAVYDSVGTEDPQDWAFEGVISKTYVATKDEVQKDVLTAGLITAPLLIAGIALYLVIVFRR